MNKNKWISVKDRLPKKGERVLVYLDGTRCSYTRIDTDRISSFQTSNDWIRWGDSVTHWMPLPDAPKGGDTNE